MALSLSKNALSLKEVLHPQTPPEERLASSLGQKFRPCKGISGLASELPAGAYDKRQAVIARAAARTNHSSQLSYIAEELQKELSSVTSAVADDDDENELEDRWRQIHGEHDWVDMLDPMDPLLRTELIHYEEMAQACYDTFNFDPSSIYCGICKCTSQKFFEQLGMAQYGYNVRRYLYATSNINLSNFFKQSRWPKVWSKNTNWIGYIAMSNDEMSKKLGRRDISIERNSDEAGVDSRPDGFPLAN